MNIYEQALAHYGGEMQTIVCVEEMSELTKELCKYLRGRDNAAAIAEEIADVEIVLAQMKLLHNCAGQVRAYRTRKLERLAQRMEQEGK